MVVELADGVVSGPEQDRFLGLVDRLPELTAEEVRLLSFEEDRATAPGDLSGSKGIF